MQLFAAANALSTILGTKPSNNYHFREQTERLLLSLQLNCLARSPLHGTSNILAYFHPTLSRV